MPLFKQHTNEPEPVADQPTRKGSMFTRRRSLSPASDPNHPANNNNTATGRRGFFGGGGRSSLDNNANTHNNGNVGRSGSVMSGNNSVRSGGSGFFGGRGMNNFDIHKDPTVMAAREKLTHAENAEAEADRALFQARAMVREAKDHVRVLEREAAAEAKRAKAKQAVSNDVSKSASGLGRHGP
ncbi:PALP domain-containing protein [Mycena venus]|uniref:PALP domain-containing protein n=1 Tax=Mycena venus TaxID=2733690 RepID=A0A8H6YFV5_9AGAR|nr:PALP domain-containing protein [Mycena venus]